MAPPIETLYGALSTSFDLPPSYPYTPQTQGTRAAYDALLAVIQDQMIGGQLPDILQGVAELVLAALKSHDTADKKKAIERHVVGFGSISTQLFDRLASIANLITDFKFRDDDVADGDATVVVDLPQQLDDDDDAGLIVDGDDDDVADDATFASSSARAAFVSCRGHQQPTSSSHIYACACHLLLAVPCLDD
ncbi:hypothetical protein U9M48_025988 [Paspalum notatum var. saurae]|uniref:Uncharacterized protein n=1 Tax=Paspalum notatum var. saurae TaxID=547442 RepID=A0AAQ3TV45_PASNO